MENLTQILHESTFKEQPDHQAAEVRPPEDARYRQSPLLQRLQLFLLSLAAEGSSSASTLSYGDCNTQENMARVL